MIETQTGPAIDTGRILVVDDNEMNRDMLSRRLRRQGHEVVVAENGRLALELLTRREFDLVLLDIMMPEMTGHELLAHLKADPALRHLPVVMISALDDVDNVVRCLEMGADDHLPKPFNPHVLRARIGACLAKKRLRDREVLYARSLERELEIGREIQAGFLPEALPAAAGWELAARFHPARQVAGDFYDAFPLADGRIGLVVADVCDKGVGAALFMAIVRSLLRALAQRAGGEGIGEVVRAISDYIARTHGRSNMFATLFCGVLDPRSGALDFVNAGHDAPLVAGAGGVSSRLAPTGPAVGLLPGLEFGVRAVTLAPGQTLLAFTDGVTDARTPGGETFGEERLLALLSPPPPSAERLIAAIDEALAGHVAGHPGFDDITLLAVRRG